MIREKCPDQPKLPFALWTRIAVQQLIKQLWEIDMPNRKNVIFRSVFYVGKQLHRPTPKILLQTLGHGCLSSAQNYERSL